MGFLIDKERTMNSASSSTVAQPPLILCIDDADIALRVRKLLLGSEGYNVLTASSGEDGLELFRQNPVELVIADHFLSAKTGTEIAREMKALKPEVPILIISAAMEKPEGLEFADGFLAKGEEPSVLLDTIADLLTLMPRNSH
jgi:CheY-like chemotaxis protein